MKDANNVRRKIRKPVAAVLSAIIALSGAAQTVLAAAPTPGVGFNGQGASNVWDVTPSATVYNIASGIKIDDFFGEATKGLVPGDERTVYVSLRNNTADSVLFSLLARAPVDEESSALTAEGGDFAALTANDSLLDEITLEISNPFGPSPLYSGKMGGAGAGIYSPAGAALGTVSAGAYGVIEIKVSVPPSLTSEEFENTLAAVEWRFAAEQYNDRYYYYPTPTPAPTPTQTPQVEITDEAPPLAEPEPEEEPTTETPPVIDIPVDIDEEDVPLAEFEVVPPKTGDGAGVFTWAAICAASGAALTVWLIAAVSRKRREAAGK
jgi:hypothetical protein